MHCAVGRSVSGDGSRCSSTDTQTGVEDRWNAISASVDTKMNKTSNTDVPSVTLPPRVAFPQLAFCRQVEIYFVSHEADRIGIDADFVADKRTNRLPLAAKLPGKRVRRGLV
jgi:hypothetical protein